MKRMLSILLMLMLVPCAALAEEDEPVDADVRADDGAWLPLRRRAVLHAAMGRELPELPENALQQHHGDERDEERTLC